MLFPARNLHENGKWKMYANGLTEIQCWIWGSRSIAASLAELSEPNEEMEKSESDMESKRKYPSSLVHGKLVHLLIRPIRRIPRKQTMYFTDIWKNRELTTFYPSRTRKTFPVSSLLQPSKKRRGKKTRAGSETWRIRANGTTENGKRGKTGRKQNGVSKVWNTVGHGGTPWNTGIVMGKKCRRWNGCIFAEENVSKKLHFPHSLARTTTFLLVAQGRTVREEK